MGKAKGYGAEEATAELLKELEAERAQLKAERAQLQTELNAKLEKTMLAQGAQLKALEAQLKEAQETDKSLEAQLKEAKETQETQVQAQKELEAQVQGRGGGKAPRKMLCGGGKAPRKMFISEYAQPSTHTANPAFQGQVRGHAKRKSTGGGKAMINEPEEPASMSSESSCDDVIQWLLWKKLRKFTGVFKHNNIDGPALATLTEIELDSMNISSLGARRTILEMAKQLSPVNPARRTHAHTHTHTHALKGPEHTHMHTNINIHKCPCIHR